MMRGFFPIAALADALRGGPIYRTWLALLVLGCAGGAAAYAVQLDQGFIVTNMTDQVSWGAYIANFVFVGGIAAAAITVVLPAYAYKIEAFRKIVFVGETLALTGMLMCLLFVTVDVGRPERSWHLVPFWGWLNFPMSLLSWDVVVVFGYLVISGALLFFTLRAKYFGRPPSRLYVPLVFGSMGWAIAVYLVEAFLFSWLGARPYWNSAIVAPRFVATAFVSGPAILVLTMRVMRHGLGFPIDDSVFLGFRRLITIALLVDLFLFAAEVFTDLYSDTHHGAPMRYLLLGAHGHAGVRVYVWLAIILGAGSAAMLLSPLRRNDRVFDLTCVAALVAVWIEKGMALIVPGFVPTPLGELADYVPSAVEILVSHGIWSFGLLFFTFVVRVGSRIEMGELRAAAPEKPG
jgi:Ni/Fe-hydrogenase subunit HybB-like protein